MFVLMMGFVTCVNGSGFRCVLQVERRIDLVYGGGSVGLMGLVSQAVHDGGRHVLGFVPSLSLSLSFVLVFQCQVNRIKEFNPRKHGNEYDIVTGNFLKIIT